MVVIHLYGVLAQVAQRTVSVHAASFDESMRALVANFPRLRAVLSKMRVSVLVNGEMIQFEDCLRPMSADRIDVTPVVGGAGPAVFILAGGALVAGASVVAQLAVGTILASAITTASVAQFGLAMLIGGISQLLFKPPTPSTAASNNDQSYNFNGAVNVAQQGGIVPIGYGRLRVGSTVISANVQTWDIPIGADATALPAAPPTNPVGPFQTDFVEEHG